MWGDLQNRASASFSLLYPPPLSLNFTIYNIGIRLIEPPDADNRRTSLD